MASSNPANPLPVLIRSASHADATDLATLLGIMGYPCSVAEALERINILQDDPDQLLLVAELNGELLGMASYDLMYYLPLGALTCRITALSVTDHRRRQGIGRLLLREVEARARSAGAARIELTTAKQRADAHVFYRACGYHESSLRFVKQLGDA